MKILSDKNWRTPFGFKKYSPKGETIAKQSLEREKKWQAIKNAECTQAHESNHHAAAHISSLLNQSNNAQNKHREVHAKAGSILRQIKHHQRLEKNNPPSSHSDIKNLIARLCGLLKQGLDHQWLKGELNKLAF